MAATVNVKNTGLRGVTIADTRISFVDGVNGILIYRGYRIEDLAKNSSFLEVAYLLLNGRLPREKEYHELADQLLSARKLPDYIYSCLRALPKNASPMDVLQATIPLLAISDPELSDDTRGANMRKAIRLMSRVPVIVAAWHRIRQAKEPLPSEEHLGHAGNFLWLMNGTKPDPEMAHDLDICLLLHADHTFNASTFACREVVSTRAHIYAGVAAGIGALSGSLHGGANARVMDMLFELESVDNIREWVDRKLEKGERIMGMGHAVYKTRDPRAKFLREMGERLGKKTGQEKWQDLSLRLEQAVLEALKKRGKSEIQPNVDFCSAPVYHMMGIPRDMMTPLFAIARIAGWCAHIIEEKFGDAQDKPVLYRPKAEYVGQYCGLMGCEYQPMEDR